MTTPVCNPRALALGMYADGGFCIWHYCSTAHLLQVLDTGYFDPAAGELGFGNVIYVRASDAIAQLVVTRIKGERVTVELMGSAVSLPVKRPRTVADATIEAAR